MLSQQQQADAWGHQCYPGPFLLVPLYGAGHASIRPAIAEATQALSACLRVFNYETEVADTGGFCCRHKTGNPNEISNHGRGIAIDVNWRLNPYGHQLVTNMPRAMIQAICGIRTNSGAQVWNWGGNWSGNKDAMHFEIVCTPGDLLTGIDWRTVPAGGAAPTPSTPPVVESTPPTNPPVLEDDDMPGWLISDGSAVWLSDGHDRQQLPFDEALFRAYVALGWVKNQLQPDGNVAIATNADLLAKIPVR